MQVEIGESIRFAHFGDAEDFEFWRQTIAEFEKSHPGTAVTQEFVTGSDEQSIIKLRQQVLSQSLPDVLLVDLRTFHEFSEQFESLDEAGDLISRLQLEPTGARAFEVKKTQRGLPFSGGNLLIFVNRKCFWKASKFHIRPIELPDDDWTVEEFLRTAERLTCDLNRDGTTDQFGFSLPRWNEYLPFIWSFGAEIADEQATHWTFSGPAAQAAMRLLRQLSTGDRVIPTEEEVPKLPKDMGFLTGKTAMCVNGPQFIPILDKSELCRDYIVAPIPRGPGGRTTQITWDGIVMKKNLPAERRKVAWQFMEWALSKEVQGRLAHIGWGIPARVDMQGEFVAIDPSRRKPFVDALTYSRLPSALPKFESLDRAITRHFDEATDPRRAFDASNMLDALARDPAVIDAFSNTDPASSATTRD